MFLCSFSEQKYAKNVFEMKRISREVESSMKAVSVLKYTVCFFLRFI